MCMRMTKPFLESDPISAPVACCCIQNIKNLILNVTYMLIGPLCMLQTVKYVNISEHVIDRFVL